MRSHLSACVLLRQGKVGINCCHAEWNSSSCKTSTSILYCTKPPLSRKLPMRDFSSVLLSLQQDSTRCILQTANVKQLISNPVAPLAIEKFYSYKLWMLNQIIQWLLSARAKKVQLLRGPRRHRAIEHLAALECYMIALAASMLCSGVVGHLAPQKSLSVSC